MILGGLQKLTLLDFPGTVACTVFTVGCNLRCPFCHNPALVFNPPEDMRISEDEFFAFLKKRQGILDGVAITGGEPLLHADIGEFIARIKSMGFKVKLDTNGTFPDRLEKILAEGNVDYIAMDLASAFFWARAFRTSSVRRWYRLCMKPAISRRSQSRWRELKDTSFRALWIQGISSTEKDSRRCRRQNLRKLWKVHRKYYRRQKYAERAKRRGTCFRSSKETAK